MGFRLQIRLTFQTYPVKKNFSKIRDRSFFYEGGGLVGLGGGGSPKKSALNGKGGGGHVKYFSITLTWDVFYYFLKKYIPTETNKESF